MKIGVCLSAFDDKIERFPELGADYIEINLTQLSEHSFSDIEERKKLLSSLGAECYSANCFFPGDIRLTGESVDYPRITGYIEDVFAKAAILGLKTAVFGSGRARAVSDGFPRERAREQLIYLCSDIIAPAAEKYGIVCCIEPLRHQETNVFNTCTETAGFIREVNSQNIRLLVDLYHMDMEGEPREALLAQGDILRHAHIASAKNGRNIPQPGDSEDYSEFFSILKTIGYQGGISLEGGAGEDFFGRVRSSIAYLRTIINRLE